MPETFDAKFTVGGTRTRVGRILLLLERASVAFADRTITVSEPIKHGVLLSHGYRPEAIGVIANLADDTLFTPRPYPPIDGRIRFVFHGTILERYGLRTLIEAVANVRHRDRIHVTIIGEGDFSAALRGNLERALHIAGALGTGQPDRLFGRPDAPQCLRGQFDAALA